MIPEGSNVEEHQWCCDNQWDEDSFTFVFRDAENLFTPECQAAFSSSLFLFVEI